MCGIAAILGGNWEPSQLDAMVAVQRHRGPDACGKYIDPCGSVGLGHNRLSIIDLSPAGRQPMCSHNGRHWIAFNGEIYNYLELRTELKDYPFRTQTDTEVILAAYQRWGTECLDRFLGMFAFVIWDDEKRQLIAARDRFGVKPLYYHDTRDGTLLLASEIKALHAAGVPAEPNPVAWASYLTAGLHDHASSTFWKDIRSLPPGHMLICENTTDGAGPAKISCWYDLADRCGPETDSRPADAVDEEYLALLNDSVRLRFRADVPVGINLSGGLDSSTLLGLVQAIQGHDSDVQSFTFITGDAQYDELPWVQKMLDRTRHPSVACLLTPRDVPELAQSVQIHQDEPFGGLPTLAYGRLFEEARARGVIVLLDGQGMDEQWAGYDYYARAITGCEVSDRRTAGESIVQGTRQRATRPECLTPEFCEMAAIFDPPQPFPDALRNLQYRDARYTKIPRALRFNDRISMRASTELREPFLDHRLFELALRQPPGQKIGRLPSGSTVGKLALRRLTARLLPAGVTEAPKRPLQTPQREWLRGCLRDWADDCIESAITAFGDNWLLPDIVRAEWETYQLGDSDNSFYVWQWLSLGLLAMDIGRTPPGRCLPADQGIVSSMADRV